MLNIILLILKSRIFKPYKTITEVFNISSEANIFYEKTLYNFKELPVALIIDTCMYNTWNRRCF